MVWQNDQRGSTAVGRPRPHIKHGWDGPQCPVSLSGSPYDGYVSAPCACLTRCWRQKYQTPPPDAAKPPGRDPRAPAVSREVIPDPRKPSHRPQVCSQALCSCSHIEYEQQEEGGGAAGAVILGASHQLCSQGVPARGVLGVGPPAGNGPHDVLPPSGGRRSDSRPLNLCRGGSHLSGYGSAKGPRGWLGFFTVAVSWCAAALANS